MDTRELFARLIKCEAGGEGEQGMQAVATVVMNRVRVPYGEYQRIAMGDLRRVILQTCQFTCCKTVVAGIQNTQNVWAATPEDVNYRVVDWAMENNIFTGVGSNSLWYMNPFNPQCPPYFPYNRTGVWFTRVNQHCFFNPTAAYANT